MRRTTPDRIVAALAILLVMVPSAGAQVLHAESLAADGAVGNLEVKYLRMNPDDNQLLAPPELRIDAPDVVLEAWYQDSGGTPFAVNRETEIRHVHEGTASDLTNAVQDSYQMYVLSTGGALLESLDAVRMEPHGDETGAFPALVPATGEEFDVPLNGTLRSTFADETRLRMSAPFTLVLWSWNITFNDGEGSRIQAWSGERPHGQTVGGISPEGFDRQLLVLQVRDGVLEMIYDEDAVQDFFIDGSAFSVDGSLAAAGAWMPATEAADAAAGREFVGQFNVAAHSLDNETLAANIAETPEPVINQSAGDFVGQGGTGGSGPAGASPTPPGGPGASVAWLFLASIPLAVVGYVGIQTYRWHRIKAHFRNEKYRAVAAEAGRFHTSLRRGGDAQVMTMVAALKLGQYQFVLDTLPRLGRIEDPVRRLLRAHALVHLGKPELANQLLEDREFPSSREGQQTLVDGLDDGSPAYT